MSRQRAREGECQSLCPTAMDGPAPEERRPHRVPPRPPTGGEAEGFRRTESRMRGQVRYPLCGDPRPDATPLSDPAAILDGHRASLHKSRPHPGDTNRMAKRSQRALLPMPIGDEMDGAGRGVDALAPRWPHAPTGDALPDTMPGGKPWPRISIVTPTYNQGRYIEETLLSVAHQGYPNLEHIVIDGGSTDDTISILHRHEVGPGLLGQRAGTAARATPSTRAWRSRPATSSRG